MRGLMQQGRASRAASPGCIVVPSPQNEKGSASVSPGRPQFIVPCLGPACSRVRHFVVIGPTLPSAIQLRDNLDRSAAAATQCVVDDQNQDCADHRNKNAVQIHSRYWGMAYSSKDPATEQSADDSQNDV
jgi:hypothetical protein